MKATFSFFSPSRTRLGSIECDDTTRQFRYLVEAGYRYSTDLREPGHHGGSGYNQLATQEEFYQLEEDSDENEFTDFHVEDGE